MADFVREWIETAGYVGVAFLMFLETVFPPIPSEVIMALSGLQAQRGTMTLAGVIAAGTMGAMTGNIVWYIVARRLGLVRFRPLVERFGRLLTLDWREVERADRFFDRHDRFFVCFRRMMPTVRSLVSVPAGLFGMKPLPFVAWSTLGTAGWTGALTTAGYLLGVKWKDVDEYLGPLSTGVVVLLLAWYLFRVATWKPRQG